MTKLFSFNICFCFSLFFIPTLIHAFDLPIGHIPAIKNIKRSRKHDKNKDSGPGVGDYIGAGEELGAGSAPGVKVRSGIGPEVGDSEGVGIRIAPAVKVGSRIRSEAAPDAGPEVGAGEGAGVGVGIVPGVKVGSRIRAKVAPDAGPEAGASEGVGIGIAPAVKVGSRIRAEAAPDAGPEVGAGEGAGVGVGIVTGVKVGSRIRAKVAPDADIETDWKLSLKKSHQPNSKASCTTASGLPCSTSNCTTTSNRPCRFPFIHEGITHTSCTYQGGFPKPWCSTLIANGIHMKGNYGDCDTNTCPVNKKTNEGLVLEKKICTISFGKPCITSNCVTTSNLPCRFPFIHEDITYTSCTYEGGFSRPWCSTLTSNGNHVYGHFGNCDTNTCPVEGARTNNVQINGNGSGNIGNFNGNVNSFNGKTVIGKGNNNKGNFNGNEVNTDCMKKSLRHYQEKMIFNPFGKCVCFCG